MTRLSWGAVGERFYEAGVDRGVLYLDNADGVPWNGLVSVNEAPNGGDTTPYYLEGVKYLNHQSSEEFEATIEAFTYPSEFGVCDGTLSIKNGLFATQQRRKSFGLAYRTRVGNDVNGIDHGYKIHLVYNARAEPSSRSNTSIADSLDPENFSWHITTKPMAVVGMRHTSHFVIDSRDTPKEVLDRIEEVLYGSETEAPRLPVVPELRYIFEIYSATYFDAGTPIEPFYATFDGGSSPTEIQTSTIDAGFVGVAVIPPVEDVLDGGTPSTVAEATIIDGGMP